MFCFLWWLVQAQLHVHNQTSEQLIKQRDRFKCLYTSPVDECSLMHRPLPVTWVFLSLCAVGLLFGDG